MLKHYEPYQRPKGLKRLKDDIVAALGDERVKAMKKHGEGKHIGRRAHNSR